MAAIVATDGVRPLPTDHPPASPRRRPPDTKGVRALITSSVLIVMILAGCGSTGAPKEAASARRPVLTTTAPAAGATTVPATTAPVTTVPVADQPPCPATQIRLNEGPIPGAVGSSAALDLEFTNTGTSSCYLLDYPTVTFTAKKGGAAPFPFVHGYPSAKVNPGPARRVGLVPGEAAYVALDQGPCDYGRVDSAATVQARSARHAHHPAP